MKKNKFIVVHPMQQHSYRLAEALIDADLLEIYITSVFYDKNKLIYKILEHVLNKKTIERMVKRSSQKLNDYTITYCTWSGLLYILASKFDYKNYLLPWFAKILRKKMASKVDEYINFSNATHIVIYDTWGFEITKKLKNKDIKIVMDMSSIPAKEIIKIITKDININGNNEFYKRFLRRYKKNYLRAFNEEIFNCDFFLVPSKFSKNKLEEFGIKENQILLCPYGINKLNNKKDFLKPRQTNYNSGPILFLYVGRITPAKGIHYLLEVFKNLNPQKAKLICVGSKMGLDKYYENTNDNIQFTGFLNKSDLAKIYEKSDVYIIPSLFEGMSLTIPEAMSKGLPVIATNSSGADSIVKNFYNGFLIDSMSTIAIENKINWFIKNKNLIPTMSKNAYDSIQNKTWNHYSNTIINKLSSI